MVTTIQISENLHKALDTKKLYKRETYEEVIWNLIEDTKELSEDTKKELAEARAEIKAGKLVPFSEIKKKMRI